MRWLSLAAAVLIAGCDGGEAVAPAVAVECRIPARFALPQTASLPDAKPDPAIDGYVLALSWSPEFCRFRRNAEQHADQCRDNRFGLIVHGLWPQAANAAAASDHPRACTLAPPVTEALVRAHFCMTPSVRLMQNQWAAHGTCGWDSAEAYYAATAQLWQSIARPDLRALAADRLNAGAVRTEFTRANPVIPRTSIAVEINGRGWLEEVRLCLDRAYAYRACPRQGAADDVPVAIWRGG